MWSEGSFLCRSPFWTFNSLACSNTQSPFHSFSTLTPRDNKQVSDPLFTEYRIFKGNKKELEKLMWFWNIFKVKKVYPYQQEVGRFILKWCTFQIDAAEFRNFFLLRTFNLDEICESFVVWDILQIIVSYLHVYQMSLYILMLYYFILSSFRLNRPSGMQSRVEWSKLFRTKSDNYSDNGNLFYIIW